MDSAPTALAIVTQLEGISRLRIRSCMVDRIGYWG